MFRLFSLFIYRGILLSFIILNASADTQIKPFVMATPDGSNFEQVVASSRSRLSKAGFEILGEYAPYPNASILIFTNAQIKDIATKSERGGYGAALRMAITDLNAEIQLSYTNPVYWANAYRLNDNLHLISQTLATAFNARDQFGSGEKVLTEEDMREYHYTMMMEYFDDPSLLSYYEDHAAAVNAVEKHLAAGAGNTQKVYRLDLGTDSKGKQMTLFGVALKGKDADDCSSDPYIMGSIDRSSPRHTAHLPYEMLVYGSNVEALYARFRIAISWPHLPMLTSDTGATFFSIMCAPGAIEDALTLAAGGDLRKAQKNEK